MSPGFWEGSDGLPNWCEVGGPGLRWESTNPLTCNQCRPKAKEPKWRHIHWDYMKEHKAKTKISKLESTLQLPDVSGEEKPCEKRTWIKLEATHEDASSCTGTCCVKSAQCVFKIFWVCLCEAASLLTVVKPTWVLADFSQNFFRMPVLDSPHSAFMCITPGPCNWAVLSKKICPCCCMWGREANIGIEGKVGPF